MTHPSRFKLIVMPNLRIRVTHTFFLSVCELIYFFILVSRRASEIYPKRGTLDSATVVSLYAREGLRLRRGELVRDVVTGGVRKSNSLCFFVNAFELGRPKNNEAKKKPKQQTAFLFWSAARHIRQTNKCSAHHLSG